MGQYLGLSFLQISMNIIKYIYQKLCRSIEIMNEMYSGA